MVVIPKEILEEPVLNHWINPNAGRNPKKNPEYISIMKRINKQISIEKAELNINKDK